MPRRALDFVFLCERKFEELPGDDPLVRRCPDCNTDVTDLDRFTDAELEEFLELADRCGLELCVRATIALPRACDAYMAPGTYVGRTDASWRRARSGAGRQRPGESFDDFLQRLNRQHQADEARLTALLARVRNRPGG